MDRELQSRLRNQTVQVCTTEKQALGSGFFATGQLVVTAEHCIAKKKEEGNYKVCLYRDSKKICDGIIVDVDQGVGFIYIYEKIVQEDMIPIGYSTDLGYGTPVDIYGYPKEQPRGYPCTTNITGNFYEPDDKDKTLSDKQYKTEVERQPSIQCLVRNKEGALSRYTGLSGSPVVVKGYIVAMVAKEDEGGNEVNAIEMLDFFCVRDVLIQRGISLTEVRGLIEDAEKKQCKANQMSLYQQVWWIMKTPIDRDRYIEISDRYSIVLATLLLGIEGEANVILASPWEFGLAEYLQKETVRYEIEYPKWKGRKWAEYEKGILPEWETIEENSGIVLSVQAEKVNSVFLSELLTGRRGASKDILVLWNIWSEQGGQAVIQALKVADQFDIDEGRDVLTAFSSWQIMDQGKRLPHTFLVHKTANDWVKSQDWKNIDLHLFLLELNAEETDVLTWVVFQCYKSGNMEGWGKEVLAKLKDVCSESMRNLISFYEKDEELGLLMEIEPSMLKRWFAEVKKEDCNKILSYLKERNQMIYWNIIVSNPYCTGDVLQERCNMEKGESVRLIFKQNIESCKDILLDEEVENIYRQIRPI